MVAGFVHGVLNTDNMNVTGESFDYGPYRFLPAFNADFVAAYFDQTGLYAYGRQPSAVLWSVSRLAEALRLLAPEADFVPVLHGFEAAYRRAIGEQLRRRLGVESRGDDDDAALANLCFEFMDESKVGFDQFFFDWHGGPASAARAMAGPARDQYVVPAFLPVQRALGERAPTTPAVLALTYFQQARPETLLIDEIEAIWARIAEADDWSAFEEKIARISAIPTAC
jgi:uncharacterized protein YdiU (UPF0061 family)